MHIYIYIIIIITIIIVIIINNNNNNIVICLKVWAFRKSASKVVSKNNFGA